jgi:hypothetical protein
MNGRSDILDFLDVVKNCQSCEGMLSLFDCLRDMGRFEEVLVHFSRTIFMVVFWCYSVGKSCCFFTLKGNRIILVFAWRLCSHCL